MKSANVATAKNELSRLLRRVKRGETVIITERNRPVARLEPIRSAQSDATIAALHEAGLLNPPTKGKLDVVAFLGAPRPTLPKGQGLTEAVLEERTEGR